MLTALWCICTRYCGGGCTIVKPQRHLFYKRMAFICYVCGVQVYVYMFRPIGEPSSSRTGLTGSQYFIPFANWTRGSRTSQFM